MKISFLIYRYFPYGGQQRDFLKIAIEAAARGHEVHAYVMDWAGELPEGIERHFVPRKGVTTIANYKHYTQWIEQEFGKNDPGVVVGFARMPGLDFHFAADPCFVEKAHTQRSRLYRLSPRYRHFKRYEEALFTEARDTQVLILSPQQRLAFSKYYPQSAGRLHDLPPGIPRDRCAKCYSDAEREEMRSHIREEIAAKPTDIVLLQIGSGFKVKGVDRSLRAMASLPDATRNRCQLVLVGEGRSEPYVNQAERLGVAEQFRCLGARDDVPALLQAADLLLHPAYSESAGYTLLEATVAGLPVLTTASCGYAVHIERANSGQVCSEPFKQEQLNQKLNEMLSSEERSLWSQNGIHYGETTDLYSQVKSAVDIIESPPCR